MNTGRYKEIAAAVIEENRKVLDAVPEADIQHLIAEIEGAKTIQLFAMGRMQASMRAFCMRLKHMGFDAYVVFDTTTPVIGAGDLLIVNCAVTAVDLNIIKLAKKAGARVCVLTAHPENEQGRLADVTVLVPGQIFGTRPEIRSIQPMASLLEHHSELLLIIINLYRWRLYQKILQTILSHFCADRKHFNELGRSADLRSFPIKSCENAMQRKSAACAFTSAVWDFLRRELLSAENATDGWMIFAVI